MRGRPDRRTDGDQDKFLRRGFPSRTVRFEFIAGKFAPSQHRKRVVYRRKNKLVYDYYLLLNKKKTYLQPVPQVHNMLIFGIFIHTESTVNRFHALEVVKLFRNRCTYMVIWLLENTVPGDRRRRLGPAGRFGTAVAFSGRILNILLHSVRL